jgi:hypothetical protein
VLDYCCIHDRRAGETVRGNDRLPMPDTLREIQELIRNDDVVVSNHGYDELAEDLLTAREIVAGVAEAIIV